MLMTEENAMKQIISTKYFESIIQGQMVKQQTKTEEVDGALVYTAMPYAVLVQLTQNFFDIMGCYMHTIIEKTWPDKLRDELFNKFGRTIIPRLKP